MKITTQSVFLENLKLNAIFVKLQHLHIRYVFMFTQNKYQNKYNKIRFTTHICANWYAWYCLWVSETVCVCISMWSYLCVSESVGFVSWWVCVFFWLWVFLFVYLHVVFVCVCMCVCVCVCACACVFSCVSDFFFF